MLDEKYLKSWEDNVQLWKEKFRILDKFWLNFGRLNREVYSANWHRKKERE